MMSLSERAAAMIPGGSLTRSKAVFGIHGRVGAGALIELSDATTAIGMLASLGASTLGYGDGVLDVPHELEVDAAEAVLAHVAPWASSIRFTMTGSEAMSAAVDIARAATGRQTVLVAENSYHGWHSWFRLRGQSGTAGQWTHTYPYGAMGFDFGESPDLAAVVVEPARWEETTPAYLRWLRDFAHQRGALFIIDEMIYGGRWALGGASEYYGVTPDIATFGKALGGGHPIACVVGNEAVKTHGDLASGTFSGYPPSLAAVVETIQRYRTERVIDTLWARGWQLQAGLERLARIYPQRIAAREGQPVHQRLRFVNPGESDRFTVEMLKRGVLWHPGCVNVMAAHTPALISTVLAAAEDSLAAL